MRSLALLRSIGLQLHRVDPSVQIGALLAYRAVYHFATWALAASLVLEARAKPVT